MAETRPTRVLDVSNNTENSEQQYVEVGSNTYLGTKDGIKYSLIKASDNTIRLVEVPYVSSINLSDSSGSFESLSMLENSKASNIKWSESLKESKDFKAVSVKSEPSPCKGQGDEIGNIVVSPLKSISSFLKADSAVLEKTNIEPTPERLNNSSVVTYTTLYPKQDKDQLVTYYISPRSAFSNNSPVFPSPVAIRPARYPRKPRMPFMSPISPYPPTPRVRRGTPRMRRPRQPVYQYTPQILHSTPKTTVCTSYSNDFSISLSGSSSGSLSDSTLSKSDSSLEYPKVPNNTPTSPESLDSSDKKKEFSAQWMQYIQNYASLNPREVHNEKERHRRLRIKNSCQAMKALMPWVDDKTDNATVFQEVASFIHFVRGLVGSEFDMEFLEQNFIF